MSELPGLKQPSTQSFLNAAVALITEFNPKKIVYVDRQGLWQENPESLLQRSQHEFLFKIWQLPKARRLAFFKSLSKFFNNSSHWLAAKNLSFAFLDTAAPETSGLKEEDIDKALLEAYSYARPKIYLPLLIALESIGWVLQLDTLRLLKDMTVSEWDKEGQAHRQEVRSKYKNLYLFLRNQTKDEDLVCFTAELLEALFKADKNLLLHILDFLSAEERFFYAFNGLMRKTEDIKKREEAYGMILEKMFPLLGIVTETSPALLRPCLSFLLDPKIELTSGIPYQASVILSILQDPRSTAALFRALDRFPFQCSKIRENIIYTLGNLHEKDAVHPLIEILNQPDKIMDTSASGQKTIQHLFEQKEEAIWALGKIGYPAVAALPFLLKITDHSSSKLKTLLAWTLGEIGQAQKAKRGGVNADIVIALLQLLKTRNKCLFEETVAALRKIELPEFIHTLYLYNVGAVNLLGLIPAQKGLYELSETIHHLVETKGKAIVAVNGDSGTGKTYFCQSLLNGFGGIKPDEILYLMRDRKKDQRIFNRILGLKWLKTYVDPLYYQDFLLSDEEDNPEQFFRDYLQKHRNKKLILLDGCRDEAYFQRIIDLFYFRGELDVEVNFRATFSTRRLNLEEREMAMESVKTHLSFYQEPALEDTLFYQEGNAILYDLDNSIASRLARDEILELFQKTRIDRWGDLIILGNFNKEKKLLRTATEQFMFRKKNFYTENETWKEGKGRSFQAEERKYSPWLNMNLEEMPNLLMAIDASDIKPEKLRFYAQDQIAGIGEGGSIFILTFLDSRIFYTFQEHMKDISLLGRDILLANGEGECLLLSFERNEIIRLEEMDSPVCALAACPKDKVISGHKDGTIRIWTLSSKSRQKIKAHSGPVLSLATDYWGRIYSAGRDHILKLWDLERGSVAAAVFPDEEITHIKPYPGEKILSLSGSSIIHIIDFKNRKKTSVFSPFSSQFSGTNIYRDGRIITLFNVSGKTPSQSESYLTLISPVQDSFYFQKLDSHSQKTFDCLVMGPRLVTCGRDSPSEHSIRVWGTDHYVRTTLSKLKIQAG